MPYKLKKSIHQYNLVDLLEILQYSSHPEFNAVKDEIRRRQPSSKELSVARRGLKYRNEARWRPLSFVDILYCLITPLIAPKSRFTQDRDVEISYDEQLAEFEYHNESRKVRQFKRLRAAAEVMYGVIGIILFLIIVVLIVW